MVLTSACVSVKSHAQKDFVAPTLGLVVHGGYVIPHRTVLKGLILRHARAMETSIEWHASGKSPWHHYYSQPSIGVDVFFNDLGNTEELGYHISMNFFVRAPIGHGDRFKQYFKFGLGPGFATKLWDLKENVRNTTVSSKVSTSLILQYGVKTQVSSKVNICGGIRLSHYSNGGLKQPNLGINTASLYIGALLGSPAPPLVEAIRPDWTEKKTRASFTFSLGRYDISPESGRLHTVWILSSLIDKRVSNKSRVGLAVDVFYNLGISHRLRQEGKENIDKSDNVQLGTALSYSLIFRQFDLKIMAGVYLKNELPDLGSIYNRFGLRYHYRKYYLSLMIKTHLSKAEYPELGIGWRI